RPLLLPEAKAHGEVEVAGVVGDLAELGRRVVHAVAQDSPDEGRLRILRLAQQRESLAPGLLLEDAGNGLVRLAPGRNVFTLGRVEPQDRLAVLAIETDPAL